MRHFLALAAIFLSVNSMAAQQGWVDSSGGVEMHEGPNEKSKVMGKVGNGTGLAMSNAPTSGFYKVRLRTGETGWIAADKISLKAPQPGTERAGNSVPDRRRKRTGRSVLIRGYFAINQFDVPALTTAFAVSSSRKATLMGGEIGFHVNEEALVIARAESLSGSVTVLNEVTSDSEVVKFSSLPIWAGIAYQFNPRNPFTMRVSAMGGMGLSSTLTVTNSAGTTTAQYSGTAFGGQALVGADWFPIPSVGVFGDFGYRLLQTPSQLVATSGGLTGVGSTPISYSGMVFGGGVMVGF